MAWTTPATLVTGATIQASWANTHVRDNERYLKGLDGAVTIQDSVSITGSVSPSVGVNVGGESGALTGEVKAKAARFTDAVAFAGAMATEIGVASGEPFVQAFNRTGAAYGVLNVVGSAVVFKSSGTEKGRVNSTGFSGDGSQLTALNASELGSGTVPDARLSSNVAFAGEAVSQFTNDSAYLTASTENKSTSGRVYTVDVTLANSASSNLCADSAGGFFFISVVNSQNFAIVYSAQGATTTLISDPSNVFATSGVASGKTNIGLSGGNVVLLNLTGGSLTYRVVRLGGG